ncbi:MAG: 50S ribosomal protein L25 [Sedimentisphaeraceae bacterium JB056]
MTDTVILKAELRENGSKKAAAVRAQGLLPAVIYGHKQDPESVSVDCKALIDGLHSGQRLYELKFDGKSETLLVKDLQYDYLGKDILHVDFMRVDLDEKADVSVMLEFKGTPEGASEGGILDVHFDSIEINCPVTSIPESITVNVKSLGIGDAIYAKDIQLPTGASLVTDGDQVVVNCHVVAEKPEVEEGDELEESAEPEVITEKNKDEE